MSKTSRVVALAMALGAAGTWMVAASAQEPAPRTIPGITAEDAFPNGCVDCHVARPDADHRLSVQLATWTSAVPAAVVEKARAASADPSRIRGRHPAVPNPTRNIPGSCLAACHKPGSTIAPPFARLMHLMHFTGSGNRYLAVGQGECTHCHKLDATSGQWRVPSGDEK